MIKEVIMYRIECDCCNKGDEESEYYAWGDSNIAEECATEGDWHRTEDGKHYCGDCHCFSDDGELLIGPEQFAPKKTINDEG